MRAKGLDDLGVVAAQLSNRIEDRQIGLGHPVLRQALPAADPHGTVGRDGASEAFKQGGLADTGLSGHEHHLALAATRMVQPLQHSRQRVLASDDRSWQIGQVQPRRR